MTDTNQQWLDEFARHLRLRGADGRGTGDALAEVESHLAESGEAAGEAFGDPAAYAAALNLPDRSGGPRGLVRALVPVLCLVAGFTLVLQAVLEWNSAVAITQGGVLAAAIYLLVCGVLVAFPRQVLGSPRLGLLIVWFVLGFAAVVAAPLILRTPLTQVPPVVALIAGVVLFGVAWLLRAMIGRDPVEDPRRA